MQKITGQTSSSAAFSMISHNPVRDSVIGFITGRLARVSRGKYKTINNKTKITSKRECLGVEICFQHRLS